MASHMFQYTSNNNNDKDKSYNAGKDNGSLLPPPQITIDSKYSVTFPAIAPSLNGIGDRPSLMQLQSRRKMSFPATLHSTSLLDINPLSARRRLSNVSDVVSRKLSYTIGWKAAQIPAGEIVTQVGKRLKINIFYY